MNNKIDITKIIKMAVDETDHPFCDEQDFRIAVVQQLQKHFKQDKPLIITEYKYKNNNNNTGRIDIFMFVNNKEYVIELKYRPNCTRSNKLMRDGLIYLCRSNKGVSIEWLIDKLNNHKTEISVSSNKSDYGAIITWKNTYKKQEKKYYIMTQNTAYECVDDINKLNNYVNQVNTKAEGYAVVLTDHQSWLKNGKIDLEAAQANNKQSTKHLINKNNINFKQEQLQVKPDTPHKGYYLLISKIQHK